MARALWVTSSPPDRALGGGHIRQAHLLEALGRAVPTDLIVIGALRDDDVRGALEEVTELPAVPPPRPLPRPLRRVRDLRKIMVAGSARFRPARQGGRA
jgi:hypothetical protein